MNMAIRGIDFTAMRDSANLTRKATVQSVSEAKDNFGKEPANSFTSDQHPDLRADYVMANPPFNISEWWDAKLEGDPSWRYGTPPRGNANWLGSSTCSITSRPRGSIALLLANGSMSNGSGGKWQIRQALIEADFVECIVALPGQLFNSSQTIPL